MKRNLLSQWLLQGQWHSHRLQMSMVMIAIALGIALGFSIQLINSAAIHEFSSAIKILSGQSDLQIRAVQPTFDEMLYPKLAQREGAQGARQSAATFRSRSIHTFRINLQQKKAEHPFQSRTLTLAR